MNSAAVAETLDNDIAGRRVPARGGELIEKRSPVTEEVLSRMPRSRAEDVADAVAAARTAQPDWARRTPVERGMILRRVAQLLERDAARIAAIVSAETGKSPRGPAGRPAGPSRWGISWLARVAAITGKSRRAPFPTGMCRSCASRWVSRV